MDILIGSIFASGQYLQCDGTSLYYSNRLRWIAPAARPIENSMIMWQIIEVRLKTLQIGYYLKRTIVFRANTQLLYFLLE